MTSTKSSKPNMIHQTPSSSVGSTPERNLTPGDQSELFGEDQNGELLPEKELNALLGPVYAGIFAKNDQAQEPPAQSTGESKTSATAIKAKEQKREDDSKSKNSKPIKTARECKKNDVPPKKKAQKENGTSKASADTKGTETKPTPKANSEAPSKAVEQEGVWNSMVQLCQQIEVYAGVKVTEHHGFDSIAKILADTELEEGALRLKLLQHADGWLELVISGALRDRDGDELYDAEDTSLINLSSRVSFQPDVEIEEFADDDALEVIDAASLVFDHDRIFSMVYRYPDGRVEFVISGPDFNADSTAETATEQIVAGNDKPILKDTTASETAKGAAAAAPTSTKRKRTAGDAQESSTEQTVPKSKKARNNEEAGSKITPTGRVMATPQTKKAGVAAASTAAPAPSAKGKRRRDAEADQEADATPSKKARTTGRPVAHPKSVSRGEAAAPAAVQAPPSIEAGRAVTADQAETGVQTNEQAAAGRPIANPKKSNRGAAAAPVDGKNLPTTALEKKAKRPTKKTTGTNRKGRQVVVAGPDPEQVPAPVKAMKRGREEENGQNGPDEKVSKRVKEA